MKIKKTKELSAFRQSLYSKMPEDIKEMTIDEKFEFLKNTPQGTDEAKLCDLQIEFCKLLINKTPIPTQKVNVSALNAVKIKQYRFIIDMLQHKLYLLLQRNINFMIAYKQGIEAIFELDIEKLDLDNIKVLEEIIQTSIEIADKERFLVYYCEHKDYVKK